MLVRREKQCLAGKYITSFEADALQAAMRLNKRFDRFFLESMIKHHGGAITMVKELFASPGAAQDSTIYAFATDVVADQQMEIDRMSRMLAVIGTKER